jgi:hypothetical protein
MKRFLTSSLLTVVAVPFLMAAPAAKTQNQPKAADQSKATTAKPKAHKVKKSKTAKTNTAAPASSTPSK